MGDNTEIVKWLFQQGVLGIVLVLVLIDYRRMYNQLVTKLEKEHGQLTVVVTENAEAYTKLQGSVDQLTRVIEELNPRPRWPERRDGDRRAT